MAANTIQLSVCQSAPNASEQILELWEGGIDDLDGLFRKAVVGSKMGSYFVRGPFREPVRSDENIIRADVLVIDGDKSVDPDNGSILERVDQSTGEIIGKAGAPAPNIAHEALQELGIPHVLYTSHSHDPDRAYFRWRAVIPAPITTQTELLGMVDWVVKGMQEHNCNVYNTHENGNWSQPWFLPRVKSQDALSRFKFFDGTDADPITREQVKSITRAWEAENKKTRSHERPSEGRSASADTNTPIGRFNAAYGNPEAMIGLMEEHGYVFTRFDRLNNHTSYRLIRPGSESGIAGVHLYAGRHDGRWLVHSHHDEDPLRVCGDDGKPRSLDAFDVYAVLKHGGCDEAAKKRAAAKVAQELKVETSQDYSIEDSDKPFISPGSGLSEIEVDDILSEASPILQKYVRYALAGSPFQVKPWAFTGALSFIGQGTARHWYGPTGLSTAVLQAIMGPTESGKDKIAFDALTDLLTAADKAWRPVNGSTLTPPQYMKRIVNRIASGKALEARLEEFPSTTFLCSEMGGVFARMTGKKPDQLMEQLKELLLSTFGKDSQTISEKVFAAASLTKSQKDALSSQIVRPCLSVIGLMTDEQAKSFDRVTVKDGLLNRFILIPSPRLEFQPLSSVPGIDQDLVEWLNRCHAMRENGKDEPVTVPWGEGSEALYVEIGKARHLSIDEQPLNHRFSMKMLKLALCFALARDIENPSIRTIDIELATTWLDRVNDAALRAILLAGGMADGDHHADLIALAMQLKDQGEGGYKPLSRVFHHRSNRDREEIVRNAVQIGIADVIGAPGIAGSKQGSCQNELVMTTRGWPRGLRIVPRMSGISQFLNAAGRA